MNAVLRVQDLDWPHWARLCTWLGLDFLLELINRDSSDEISDWFVSGFIENLAYRFSRNAAR